MLPRSKPRNETAAGPAINGAALIHDSIIATYRKEISNYSRLDRDFEALRIKIADVQQRRNLLEDSFRAMRCDYENELEQQDRQIQVLEQDMESYQRCNEDL